MLFPMTTRLFVNSNDVADMLDCSLRDARNILKSVRSDYGLDPQWKIVSIFHFCESFDLPLVIIYEYINHLDFQLKPNTTETGPTTQPSSGSRLGQLLDLSVFEPYLHQPRTKN